MKQRMTGVGKLSSKLLTILAMVVVPTLGHTADNSIYIDQAGDQNTITVNQKQGGNTIGGVNGVPSNSNRAAFNGDNNTILIEQAGRSNSLGVSFNNDNSDRQVAALSTGVGVPMSFLYRVEGANNTVGVTVGAPNAKTMNNQVLIDGNGSGNSINGNVTGNNNTLMTGFGTGYGSGTAGAVDNSTISSTINGAGNITNIHFGDTGNTATTTQTGDNNSLNVNATGASNTVTSVQDSTLATGHTLQASVSGSGNTINTYQGGGVNSTINMNVAGSGNSITLNSNKP